MPGGQEAWKLGGREAVKPGSYEAGRPGSYEAGRPGSRDTVKFTDILTCYPSSLQAFQLSSLKSPSFPAFKPQAF